MLRLAANSLGGKDKLTSQSNAPYKNDGRFPIARIAAIIWLSCGAILNLGICRYSEKGQGEVSLLRQLWNILCPGDVLLTDCLMSNWAGFTLLHQRGVETVSGLNKAVRSTDCLCAASAFEHEVAGLQQTYQRNQE